MTAWTREQVLAKLGEEAQSVPGGILVYRGKHIMVALDGVDGSFTVTDEGRSILEDELEVISTPKPRKTAAKKPVADVELDLE